MTRFVLVTLLLLSTTASATWTNWLPNVNLNWGNGSWGGGGRPPMTWAYQGQYCSYYQGYGPQCAPGLVCTSQGFNTGFGVCQAQGCGNNNGSWNRPGHGGWRGGHGGWRR